MTMTFREHLINVGKSCIQLTFSLFLEKNCPKTVLCALAAVVCVEIVLQLLPNRPPYCAAKHIRLELPRFVESDIFQLRS